MEAPWGRAGLPGWARRSSVGGRKQRNDSKQAGGRFKWTLQLESPRPGQAEELQSPQAFQVETGGCCRVREGVRVWPGGVARRQGHRRCRRRHRLRPPYQPPPLTS